jgi:phytoene dehydrogenase-like protein
MGSALTERKFDVAIVGGGHNGLTAAAYLARAGLSVAVLEATDAIGGATQSVAPFPGVDVRLSRYAYLVSLLPDQIVAELGLDFQCAPRSVSSYTPDPRRGNLDGLLVSADPFETEASFLRITGSYREYQNWRSFYALCRDLAESAAPTLLKPLRSRAEFAASIPAPAREALLDNPIGDTVNSFFSDDLVRGVVLTDALIGTFADTGDTAANRCFWYHVIGNGTGQWRVPVGGMGSLVGELERVARASGALIELSARVSRIDTDGVTAKVELLDGRSISARWVLCGAAPAVLDVLLGRSSTPSTLAAQGAQMKMNMILDRLPLLRSGVDPRIAFSGTLHIRETASDLGKAFLDATAGLPPSPAPAEIYCHTLTDPSILGPGSWHRHTLTLFGLHTPAEIFKKDHEGVKAKLASMYIEQLNDMLWEPIEDLIARDADDQPCIEVKSPLDLEQEIGLPAGNIFHQPLSDLFSDELAGKWGVETDIANVLLCGAGAQRGGGVSGVPGRSAAMRVLEETQL